MSEKKIKDLEEKLKQAEADCREAETYRDDAVKRLVACEDSYGDWKKQGRKEVLEEFDKTFGFSSWKESDGLTFHDKIWIRNMKIKWEGVLASIEAEKDDTEMLMKKVRLEPTSSEKSLGSASPSETSKCECGADDINKTFLTSNPMEHAVTCPKFKENRG